MLFKAYHIKQILNGEKTMTRRIQKRDGYKIGRKHSIRSRWFAKAEGYIIITRKFCQRLGDISQEDCIKEGYRDLDSFKAAWLKICESWDPDQIVTVYEFSLTQKT